MNVSSRLRSYGLGKFVREYFGITGQDAVPLMYALIKTVQEEGPPSSDDDADGESGNETDEDASTNGDSDADASSQGESLGLDESSNASETPYAEAWENTFAIKRYADEGFTFKPPGLTVMMHVNFPNGGKLTVGAVMSFIRLLNAAFTTHPGAVLWGYALQEGDTRADVMFYPGGLSLTYWNRPWRTDVTIFAAERANYPVQTLDTGDPLRTNVVMERTLRHPYAVEGDTLGIAAELYATSQLAGTMGGQPAMIVYEADPRDGVDQPPLYYLRLIFSKAPKDLDHQQDRAAQMIRPLLGKIAEEAPVYPHHTTPGPPRMLKQGLQFYVHYGDTDARCELSVRRDIQAHIFARFMSELFSIVDTGDCRKYAGGRDASTRCALFTAVLAPEERQTPDDDFFVVTCLPNPHANENL
ncbi:MAG: hypothetical protein M1833_006240 [Piccolia ochrophora]|nr:MAG: hypothetical protein M1833_006240 [Piccolia ochrophora]